MNTMNSLLDNPDFLSNNVWQGGIFLIPSIVEVFMMFENSSRQMTSDGSIVVDGIYTNCTTDSPEQQITEYFLMGLSLLFLIIFSFLIKRTSFKKHICGGRPGALLPMSMLDNHDNIIEFTLAFLSVSEDIYSFIFGLKSEFGDQIPIVKFFIKLLIVGLLSITSYLTFAGLQNRYLIGYIFAATISASYSYGGVSSSIIFSRCLTRTKIIPFFFSVMVFSFFDISLFFIFLYKTIKHIKMYGLKMRQINPTLSKDNLFCNLYVKMLFMEKKNGNVEKEDESIEKPYLELLRCNRLKNKIREKVYKEIPGFSIPPRLIIGLSVGSYFAYKIFIDQIYAMTPTFWDFIKTLNMKYSTTNTDIKMAFKVIISNYSLYKVVEIQNAYRYLTFYYVHLLIGCAITGIVFGFLNTVVHFFLILRNYRLNFQNITQNGFSSMIDLKQAPPPYGLILGFIRFSGYQAAYILWGILIVFFMITLLLYFLIGFFLLPLFYVENSWSRRFLINYGPVLLASMILNFIQTLIVKYIFVKEKGELMEINNRKAFIIFCHCAFFLNAMMGLFTSIKRIIIWSFSGVLCFCRIDFSSLPNYLKGCDNGYIAYIGFLYTEQYHHNPILRYFVNILVESEKPSEMENYNKLESKLDNSIQFHRISPASMIYRNKWRVAYTLIRNQSLLAQRKSFLNNAIF